MESTADTKCSSTEQEAILTCRDIAADPLYALLARYGLSVTELGEDAAIPGSYWGEPETGLIGNRLYLRPDTPVHSVLHESCHYICMSADRRGTLHTDAGGDYDEENAVCYLQILLAGLLEGVGSERLARDMDRWGYSFRLGSAWAWFERDAEDARCWLQSHNLIRGDSTPTWKVRR